MNVSSVEESSMRTTTVEFGISVSRSDEPQKFSTDVKIRRNSKSFKKLFNSGAS